MPSANVVKGGSKKCKDYCLAIEISITVQQLTFFGPPCTCKVHENTLLRCVISLVPLAATSAFTHENKINLLVYDLHQQLLTENVTKLHKIFLGAKR